jgi:4'-phosphopantetheinyl transferase
MQECLSCGICITNYLYTQRLESMKIKIYYTVYQTNLPEERLRQLFSMLPNNLKEIISGIKDPRQLHISLFGKHLLIKALADHGYPGNLNELKYLASGRPFIEGNADFNISHSGNLVACVFTNSSMIGIDIEEIKPIELSDFKNQFSQKEWAQVMLADNPIALFYSYWTMKESVLKADGRGISGSLLPAEIVSSKKVKFYADRWYIHKIALSDNYACHIASKIEEPEIEYFKISF